MIDPCQRLLSSRLNFPHTIKLFSKTMYLFLQHFTLLEHIFITAGNSAKLSVCWYM